LWAVPQRLQEVAELQVARGLYAEADATYAQAETFLDALIGGVSTALEKTAIITTSSQIYSGHFALVADHLNDPDRAYRIIEQVRGRVEGDLLTAGLAHTAAAKATERTISQLRLKLMASRSTGEIAHLRDQIFLAEQARWSTPLSVLKSKPLEIAPLDQVQRGLPVATALLEYVSADPNSYCLMITRTSRRIVRLDGKKRIEARVHDYLKSVKAKMPETEDARGLYDALLGPMGVTQYRNLLIVSDGQLHLLPFDALREPSGRFVVEVQNVIYGPSATSLFLLAQHPAQATTPANALLAVGGIPYSASHVDRSVISRGGDHGRFADLPSSGDEVEIARAAFTSRKSAALTGVAATETAFKAEDLSNYRVLHLAVHAFADPVFPERAALVLLSDRLAGEDGYLQASEVVQLRLNADLVVLSACDTAVGPLQGQEGIANLSRAFLLAGARTVVSTLWEVNDASSLFLMKHFYTHLVENQPAASALTAAKRDMLRTFGRKTPPYQWAGFTIEGAATRPLFDNRSEEKK
jgi:CHAT domain-containing protein